MKGDRHLGCGKGIQKGIECIQASVLSFESLMTLAATDLYCCCFSGKE